jgi:hypothetical protein
MVKGQADAPHVRAMEEAPIDLDDIVLELTEGGRELADRQRHRLVWRSDRMRRIHTALTSRYPAAYESRAVARSRAEVVGGRLR